VETIVLDTNVLISALLFHGPPRRVLELAVTGRARLVVSPSLVEELQGVLTRPKFGLTAEQVTTIVAQVVQTATVVRPRRSIEVCTEDPDDNIVLECAAEAQASTIVTGDNHLLRLKSFEGIRIVTPQLLLEEWPSARLS
jgi:putative PIN family toxin of toxin-antitoxin system